MAEVLLLRQEHREIWPHSVWEAALQGLDLPLREEILRFRQPPDRQQRLAARLLLRQGLRLLGLDASLAGWRRDSRGRPFLAATAALPQPPDFSCSHAPGFTVVALGLGCRVGVDVERISCLDALGLGRALSTAEKAWAGEGNARAAALWTRKEAVLKGQGMGFGRDPGTVEVLHAKVRLGAEVWWWRTISMPEDFVCHLACNSKDFSLRDVVDVPSPV